MQADLERLINNGLDRGVRIMAERFGCSAEAAGGAITHLTLEAVLEVLPPPHKRFVEEGPDYYQQRINVAKQVGANAALVVWSLEDPLVWLTGFTDMPDQAMDRLPWRRERPLREDFKDTPPLFTPEEALRVVNCVLRVDGVKALETPVLLPPETEGLVQAVAARLRVIAEGRTLEETAQLIVERNKARWQEEGDYPQAVGVVDVGAPLPMIVTVEDPRPLRWERILA